MDGGRKKKRQDQKMVRSVLIGAVLASPWLRKKQENTYMYI